MIPFNDISYAQGLYNMDADPNIMIMMKASGFYTVAKTGYLDSQLVRNYANAIRLGKIPFMYHFAGGADPIVEASYFASAVSPWAVGDGYALDFEVDTADNPGWVLAFLDHFTALVGTPPWFYVDRSRRETGDWSKVIAKYSEWIAAPDVPFNANIPGVGVYVAQQGPIVGGHDTNMFFGTEAELRDYTHKAPAPVNEPVPTRAVTPTPVATTTPEEVAAQQATSITPVSTPAPVNVPPATENPTSHNITNTSMPTSAAQNTNLKQTKVQSTPQSASSFQGNTSQNSTSHKVSRSFVGQPTSTAWWSRLFGWIPKLLSKIFG